MTRARDARAPRAWTAAHKRAREHDEHDDWRRRRRHVLAFTSAGKPAWTRYGSTHGVSGLCATLQALGAVSASAMGESAESACAQSPHRYMLESQMLSGFNAMRSQGHNAALIAGAFRRSSCIDPRHPRRPRTGEHRAGSAPLDGNVATHNAPHVVYVRDG